MWKDLTRKCEPESGGRGVEAECQRRRVVSGIEFIGQIHKKTAENSDVGMPESGLRFRGCSRIRSGSNFI
ncbi:hypothetical protein L2E82_44086 [Cichorium intybus]|uniref:Uncharacterized protein n=1 Tax=Cichorium intybus TaxID=13427 RepID=A0ACB8ZPC1_CICIN|nr:hypothetical protein L2E82_44086 [Cichorium intybus]